MNSQDIDEDALDSEALQAQIDLSMSFAQGLVSSWMAPHNFPKNPRKKDLEKELTEYMRRPPRLGVGASIPEGHQSLSRETARLKGKLVGSKRSREEEEVAPAKQAFDGEGESRAIAIKKKARPDPFDVVHGKKKKKQKLAEPVASAPALSSPKENQSKDDSSGEVEDILLNTIASLKENGSNSMNSTPVKDKKKKKKTSQIPDRLRVPPDGIDDSVNQASASPNLDKKTIPLDSPLTPQRKSDSARLEPIDFSPTSTPRNSNALTKPFPPALTNIPLLNLTGPPPSDLESDDEQTTSPKKKRKRRKKKKLQSTSYSADV